VDGALRPGFPEWRGISCQVFGHCVFSFSLKTTGVSKIFFKMVQAIHGFSQEKNDKRRRTVLSGLFFQLIGRGS
jgi:hypothetical protein